MTEFLSEYRIRVRAAADDADLLVATSVRGDVAPNYPYIKSPPRGDGASFNPLSGESLAASYTGTIIDGDIGSSQRVVTSKLEDVDERLQLGYLKAFVERRIDGGAWGVLCAGYLTLLRLIDALTWEFTIQEASRVHGGVELFNAVSTTTIADFLTTWPNRGCLFGGPIKGSFLTLVDRGGWTMRPKKMIRDGVDSGASVASAGDIVWMDPVDYYGPPNWRDPDWNSIADLVNTKVLELPRSDRFKGATVALSTIADVYNSALAWPGLILLIDDVVFRPYPTALAGGQVGLLATKHTPHASPALFAYQDGQTALSKAATYRVRCLTVLPSEISPIYVDQHPLDFLTTAWDAADLDYDAAAVTDLKSHISLGTGLRLSRRITRAEQMGQMIQACVFEPFGVAVRVNSAGQLVPFSTRILDSTLPSTTITDAHLKSGGSKLPFEQDVSQGIQRLTFRQSVFSLEAGVPDGVAENDNEITLLNGEANPLLSGTVEINVPGMVRPSADVAAAPVDEDWLEDIATQLFDRYGRGNQGLEYELARGDGTTDADTLALGDEVIVDISELPNHNYRLGDNAAIAGRAMQATRIDELPDSRVARFADSGPNAQPINTVPTLSIALSADRPRTVAEITITNAATMNAEGLGIRVQIAVTTGAAPATGDYSGFFARRPEAVPTAALRLPAATPGRTVFVRARSERPDERPSAWSTVASVALSALNAPTGLAAAPVAADGSVEDLTWTIGSGAGDAPVHVWLRVSGAAFSTAVLKNTLDPGSNRFRLEGLTPGASYTASVQHVEPDTRHTSALAEVTFTTSATTRTLAAPIYPVGFSGVQFVQ